MRASILTLFPDLIERHLETSLLGRAREAGVLDATAIDLRPFGLGKHRSVDDTPYGGGSGMVMRVEPIVAALEHADALATEHGAPPAHRVLLTPQGRPLHQRAARALADRPHLALVCGRYEGFDERVRSFVHEEISLGDFVLLGGEVAAMAILEATVRLLPNVLGNEASAVAESHSEALGGALEYPQYTRPVEFRGLGVPEVLKGGNHAAIDAWRAAQSLERTRTLRPDLLRSKGGARGRVAVALVHHPILDREGLTVTSAMTNLDLHDIARSSRTFGVTDFFIVHPIEAQRELAERIRSHWVDGSGKRRIPDRATALEIVRVVPSLEDAYAALGGREKIRVITTAARARDGEITTYAAARAELQTRDEPSLILFGTGWGLTPEVLATADVRLEPIAGATPYNHLSVRAACAITLDRLLAP
ncbi:MAG: tRNA (guanosine(37)-N1)-methyltransferase TrmD [Polyangiaceae bacterium]